MAKSAEELIKGLRQNKGHLPTKGSEYNRKLMEEKKREEERKRLEALKAKTGDNMKQHFKGK